ncbi:septation protein A [Thiothrix eikelboomii]|uniref:septation protein A n=1 Tax=Thiothrix eikelboomii TaxID=92487 RepID=UPI003BAF7FC7
MKFLFDFFPVLLFFLAYKLFDAMPPELIEILNQLPFVELSQAEPKHAILFATLIIILATILQNILHYLVYKRLERMHLISLVILLAFGSLTLILKDSAFIQWKVTVFNWLFALVFIGSQYVGNRKPLVERMMSNAMQVPAQIWTKVNWMWAAFFVFIGVLNLVVAYNFSEAIWVDFKLFGILGLTFVFVIAQAIYLQRHMIETGKES